MNNNVHTVNPNIQRKYLKNQHHIDIINTKKSLFHPRLYLFLILIILFIVSIIKSKEATKLSNLNTSLNQTLTTEINTKLTSEHKYTTKLKELKITEHHIHLKQQLITQLKINITNNLNIITSTNKAKSNVDIQHKLNELTKLYEKVKQKEQEYKIQLRDIYVVLANKESQYKKLLDDITQIKNKIKTNHHSL